MRLTELPRTTGFRLGLMFLTLFGACSLLLFAFVYWQTVGYMRVEQEDWLQRETVYFSSLTDGERLQRLAEHVRNDPGNRRPFGEFDGDGHWLAGNFRALPPVLRRAAGSADYAVAGSDGVVPYRGRATRLGNGHWLAIGLNVHELHEFEERLLQAMLGAVLLTLMFGLAGALAVGLASMRRIDELTGAIRHIVGGGLAGRLPARTGGGDLDRLALEVNGMLDDLERLMHEVKGVCDGIAHDLRTPLTRLLAGLERAQRNAATPAQFREAIADAIEEIGGLLKTFNALLRISEIEAGARRAGFAAVALEQVLADVVEFYQPLAEARQIALRFEQVPPAGPARVSGDASLLFDAVANLVDNAIKYTPPGGHIEVRLDAARHRLEVGDTGPGIPADARKAVLNRFHRNEPSRTQPGNGLGLSLVAVVARLHDMELEIGDADPGCRVTLAWRG